MPAGARTGGRRPRRLVAWLLPALLLLPQVGFVLLVAGRLAWASRRQGGADRQGARRLVVGLVGLQLASLALAPAAPSGR